MCDTMTFNDLKEFLESKMRLSHIYQPLLIKSLIESGGAATLRQLACAFLAQDESQLLYYEKRLKEMPIKVLSKHDVIKKDGEFISLNTGRLNLEQRAELKKICEQKMQEYIVSRGLSIWDYRLLDESPASDELRLRVLREAKGRCALCGTTKDERPLDVDHIIPRSKGGKTVYENLQVLCSKCNRTKRDRDDTDYRHCVEAEFQDSCAFCQKSKGEKLIENDHGFAVLDGYPVTKGHTLIIPKRHFSDYFDITKAENDSIYDLIRVRKKQLGQEYKEIQGFNVGINSGEVAGQTIWHCHIHLIPRRKGDIENPRGGVRGVIPSRMSY
jgi:ATP adenylyltransferase